MWRTWIVTSCIVALSTGAQTHGLIQANSPARMFDIPSRFSAPAELRYDHGYVIVIERSASAFPAPGDHTVSVLDASGREIFTRAPSSAMPDARVVTLENASIDANGLLVVAVQAWNAQGSAAAALIVYDISTGRTVRVIRTNPVICLNVATDEQQGVWCLGPDADAARAGRNDYSLLWRYALTGELLSQSAPRNTFPATGGNPWSRFATLTTEGQSLRAWFPNAATFIEVAGDALRIAKAPAAPSSLPQEPLHVVMLPGRNPLAMATTRGSAADRNSLYRGFFEFDGTAGRWNRLNDVPELPIGVWPIGVDHGYIVLWDRYQRAVVRMAEP